MIDKIAATQAYTAPQNQGSSERITPGGFSNELASTLNGTAPTLAKELIENREDEIEKNGCCPPKEASQSPISNE